MSDIPDAVYTIFGSNADRAIAYHDSLATDGSLRGFLGPKEVPRLWDRHILNCAMLADIIPDDARVVDIGSGAGLPGIPLALARPDLRITLLEPLLKRSTYLTEVVDMLELDNAVVVRGRAEDRAIRKQIGLFDVATSRAVAPLGKLAAWSLPLLHIHGDMIAIKGASIREEIERDGGFLAKIGASQPTIITIGDFYGIEPVTIIRVRRRR